MIDCPPSPMTSLPTSSPSFPPNSLSPPASYPKDGATFGPTSRLLTLIPAILSTTSTPLWIPSFPASPHPFSSLCLHLPNSQELPFSPLIESWFRLVCARRVEFIQVTTDFPQELVGYSGGVPLAPPVCMFQTHSLCVLDLSSNLDYKLPDVDDNVVIGMPNLNKLKLCLRVGSTSDFLFVSNLTRHCQSLQVLVLYGRAGGWDDNCVVDISGLKLRNLDLRFSKPFTTTEFFIDAPRLKCFHLFATILPLCCFVRKPIALQEANIFTTCSVAELYALLPVISNVTVLRTNSSTFSSLQNLVDKETFPNFTDLVLVVRTYFDANFDHIELCSKPPPAPMLLHVRIIKLAISDLEQARHLFNLAKYLLSHAPVLEWLVVHILDPEPIEYVSTSKDGQTVEANFCKELFGYPRSSSCCEIVFSGQFFQT